MRIATVTGLILLALVFSISQNAEAQLEPNQAFSLSGTGFTLSQNSALDSNMDLLFTINQVTGNNANFALQNGQIVIDQTELNISNLSGSLLKNGKLFRISFNAEDNNGDKFTVSMLGRLVDTISSDSIYTMTGTFTDSSNKLTKMIFTTKAAEFKPNVKAQTSGVTVKILKGSADPTKRTYTEQSQGFTFKYFSDARLTIPKGTTVTFVNEDTASHSLKSGTANYFAHNRSFEPDGKFSSGEIQPGKSWTVTYDQAGFYRIFDENYQWMDMTVFVSTSSSSVSLGTNVTPAN